MGERFADLILLAPAVLFALVIHEYAHGLVADRLGDPTPRAAGRLTMNPLRHLDPIGTVMFFVVRIGWARPVPVNPTFFKNPRSGMVWVSLAGPMANVGGALGCGLLLRMIEPVAGTTGAVVYILAWAMMINLILAAFNLLPVPPLDGSKILSGILPTRGARAYLSLERLGPMLLLFLIFLGRPLIWGYIRPFVRFFSRIFAGQGAMHFLGAF